MLSYLLFGGVGYLAGCFTPGVARKVKAAFVKEAKLGSRLVDGEVKAAQADLKADAQKVVKKL